MAAPGCQSWGGQKGEKFLEGPGGLGSPAGSRGRAPEETKAFCLNIYKILSVHGRKFSELDFMHSDKPSIISVVNKVNYRLQLFVVMDAFTPNKISLMTVVSGGSRNCC